MSYFLRVMGGNYYLYYVVDVEIERPLGNGGNYYWSFYKCNFFFNFLYISYLKLYLLWKTNDEPPGAPLNAQGSSQHHGTESLKGSLTWASIMCHPHERQIKKVPVELFQKKKVPKKVPAHLPWWDSMNKKRSFLIIKKEVPIHLPWWDSINEKRSFKKLKKKKVPIHLPWWDSMNKKRSL